MDSEVRWFEKPLGAVTCNHDGKRKPVKESERKKGPYPYYGASGIVDYVDGYLFEGRHLLIAEDGENLRTRQTPIAFMADGKFWVNNHAHIVTGNGEVTTEYLHYFLQNADIQSYLTGAVMPKLTQGNLNRIPVRYPEPDYQKSIVRVPAALDAKIDLNRRINQTLEAMAQAIFKSWFVDFDPVKAKIAALQEGRDPLRAAMSAISGKSDAELDALPPEQYDPLAATAALFPDEMEESALGKIPKEWSHQALAQLTDKIGSGATPRGGKEVYLADGVALIRSQNVYDSLFVWEGLARISDEAATQLKGVTVQEDDVLLNITGASILRTCVVAPDALPARVNQHVAIIRAKVGVPPRFIHMHLLRSDIKSYLFGLNAGASREAITKAHIESLTLLTPLPELLAAFQTATDPLFRQVQSLAQQMRVLGELRDSLLPKLLSGELSVAPLNDEVAHAL
ncbi:MAG: restriction endonuclease subunit S [Proteobacteria bacterium]|nr:restriction endonuclease subunit S [Pseudomonadota bacterium]